MPEPVTSVVIIAVSAVVVAATGYKAVKVIAEAPAKTIGAVEKGVTEVVNNCCTRLGELFGARPRLAIDQQVKQKADLAAICELCLAKTEIEVVAKCENKWMGSTKRFSVQETFQIKAGYDLNRLKLDFNSKQKRVRVTISEATIVNVVKKQDLKILEEGDGWWNKLTSEDRAQAINTLPDRARKELKRSGAFAMAEAQLKVVLERIFTPFGFAVDVVRIDDTYVIEDDHQLGEMSTESRVRLGLIETVTPIGRELPAEASA